MHKPLPVIPNAIVCSCPNSALDMNGVPEQDSFTDEVQNSEICNKLVTSLFALLTIAAYLAAVADFDVVLLLNPLCI